MSNSWLAKFDSGTGIAGTLVAALARTARRALGPPGRGAGTPARARRTLLHDALPQLGAPSPSSAERAPEFRASHHPAASTRRAAV